jgi:hypothetical protein
VSLRLTAGNGPIGLLGRATISNGGAYRHRAFRLIIMRPRRPLLALTAAIVTLLAACGDDGPAAIPTVPVPEVALDAGAADDVLLSVEPQPGFVGPLDAVRLGPRLVVFGDGRVLQDVTESLETGETPAVPEFEQRQLTDQGLATLYERLTAAGVTAEVDFGEPPITDLDSLRLEVAVGDEVVVNSVYAPGVEDGLSGAERDARAAVDSLLADLDDLDGLLGDNISAAEPAPFERGLAFTETTDRFADSGPGAADAILAQDWPLAAERAADSTDPLVCTEVEGDDLDTLLDAARSEFTATLWELEDGSGVDLVLRPAPDGDDCASFSGFAAR